MRDFLKGVSLSAPVVTVLAAALAGLLLVPTVAGADEGMWTFNNFPSAKVKQAYGFSPDPKWLERVQLASVRLARGCSGAFVSASGLVQTNHHCARACIQQVSTADHNHIKDGFYAAELKDEAKCPDMEVNQLVQITDVTQRVNAATAGKEGDAFSAALKEVQAAIQTECTGGADDTRCDVVELYHGGAYNLYMYHRYQDVRLVFAPEEDIAFFGGDPDNFEFPRYDLDVSYVRVYDKDGKPLNTKATYFPYASHDANEGDLVFTSGNPGRTERLDTVAELEYERDHALPDRLLYLSELRGILLQFTAQGEENARIARTKLFTLENSYKALYGGLQTLVDPALINAKRKEEAALKALIDADPALKQQYGDPWAAIAKSVDHYAVVATRYQVLEGSRSFTQSDMFTYARNLVRAASERPLPDGKRLREYTDANFPSIRQRLLSNSPVYPELERVLMRMQLVYMQRQLGPDDPLVRKVFRNRSAQQIADELVKGSGLGDPAERKRLLEGGQAALDASTDPMITFAKLVDADALAARRDVEANVSAVQQKNAGYIAQAMFKVHGTSVYPDATFSPRVSYGTVKGYEQNGQHVAPFTTMGGTFDRATGAFPFALPDSWLKAKDAINPAQKFDAVSTNDIIGGNSGSPVINKDAEVVGLIFDGNIQSLGGDYGYDGSVNRAVWVSVGALKEALAKVYQANRLSKELGAH
ncbi:dipeptidyl-peptidase 7 [Nitrospirillum amazonense]|uniref:Dipeptidyl-peptidase n=1 Tax=Nitrospirillum amazonense TaxID=28077 RepID=A0A560KI20_9PROT|nr:S46 family peptidase [Nitrospirillum amazonense]TWB82877.1 dipeptidyl-peptidase 7 [Nitrospirillum amazonense]